MPISVAHATAADGTFSAAGVTAWDAAHSLAGFGTGVATALAVNVGSAGAFVTFDGALGTPASGTLTNATGLPAAGVTGTALVAAAIGTTVQAYDADLTTWAGITPGANVGTALGVAVGSAGAFVTFDGALGTPSSGTLTNCTFPTLNQNTSGTAAGLSATLVVGSGGTGLATIADAAMLATNSANVLTAVVAGASQALRRNAGNTAWEAFTPAAGSGATLDGITAATADQAGIANADWNVRWNWAKTTNSEVAFEIGESAASTNGTSTSGVPNQVITKFSTVADSTASPLSVYSRALHVFSVSPDTRQILATAGTASLPSYSFAADPNSGMFVYPDTGVVITVNAKATLGINDNVMILSGTSGLSVGSMASLQATLEITSNVASGDTIAISHPSASSVGNKIGAYKSRGSYVSPAVITTGDDLLTLSGYGYVGATGTYVEAATLRFDSTGTIANTTSGVGGIARMELAAVGAVGPVEVMRWQRATTTGGGWATMNEADASPTTTDLADGDEAAIYVKAGNIVFAQNVGGAMKFLFIPIDGSTTLWTADGTGP